MSRLTLLMSLKGRPLHTLRFLWHANRIGLPYRILITDGQVTQAMAELLEAPARAFPRLNLEYVRYPDDVTYGDWYRKVASVTERIRTPYVMHAENDDFVVASGVEHCLNRLDAMADYVSYGGGFGAFSLDRRSGNTGAVVGAINSLSPDCYGTYIDQDYASASASERIPQLFSKSYTLYYNVFRTPALAATWRECAELNFTDLEIFETYFGARAKSLGKSRIDRSVMSYMWQAGTSMTAAPLDIMWDKRIREGRAAVDPVFEAEVEAFATALSAAIAKADGAEADRFAAEFRRLCHEKYRSHLAMRLRRLARKGPIDLCKSAVQKALAAIAPETVRRLAKQRRLRHEHAVLLNELRSFGASDNYVSTFNAEFAAIKETLEGSGFIEFVRRVAPELVGAEPAAMRHAS